MLPRGIRSEVFLREDIESVLRAIDTAGWHFSRQTPESEEFRAGFRAALEAVAEAFHSSLLGQEMSVADRLDMAFGSRPLLAHAEGRRLELPDNR